MFPKEKMFMKVKTNDLPGIGSPDINEKILPVDTLMCIGTREQTQKLEALCQRK
jgi:K+/H+ antiporter YhaU regulatory subunit KhtT